MSLQELFQGMKMFSEGMQQFGVARGITQAQEEVTKLNQMEMDGIQKRAAMTQISNTLAQNLYKTGAPVAQIQGAVGSFAPPAIKDSKDALIQGTTSGSLMDLSKSIAAHDLAPDISKIDRKGYWDMKAAERNGMNANGRADAKTEQQKRQATLAYQKEFNRLSKDSVGQLSNLSQAERLVDIKNPVADKTLKTFLARASGEKGPLSVTDIEQYGGSPALARKIQRYASEKAAGMSLTPEDRKEMKQVIQNYRETTGNVLADNIEQLSGQIAENYGGNADEYHGAFVGANPTLKEVIKKRRESRTLQQDTGQSPATSNQPPAPTDPKQLLEMFSKKPDKGAALRKPQVQRVAGGSFYQGNQPGSVSTVPEYDMIKDKYGEYEERLLKQIREVQDSQRKITYNKKA